MLNPAPTMNGPAPVTAVGGPTFRPLRLNFAQVCYVCGTRWCEASDCVAYHQASTWAVCTDCDGFDITCPCYGGLVEVDPEHLPALTRELPATPPTAPVYRVAEPRRVIDAPWGYFEG